MPTRASLFVGFILGVASALGGCGGSDLVLPSETGPADLALVRGDNQSGPAGAELAEPLVVKVTDRRGQGLGNARVAFSLEGEVPGASVSPDTAETGADGTAEARWVLGSVSGTQTVIARVVGADGLTVTFRAAVGAAGAARIERVSGDDQRAPIGSPLQDPLVVRVSDGFGNPVAGVGVEWSAAQGSVAPTSTVTGDDGRAATSWTLGATVGTQTATASSLGLDGSPLVFTATAASGDAASLVRVSGDDQSAPAGTELPNPLVVRLIDVQGNGVPNRAVSWVVATGGGSVSSANTTTDGEGLASTRWTLGPSPGDNTLNAVVSGIGVVGFAATGTGGGGGGGSSASRLVFTVQPSDTERDKRISPPVEVMVVDQAGNRVTDEEFEIKLDLIDSDSGRPGRGRLKGDDDERTVAGVATFDDLKVDREGHYRLRASAMGLPFAQSDEFDVQAD